MIPDSPRLLFYVIETLNNLGNRVDIVAARNIIVDKLSQMQQSRELYQPKVNRLNIHDEPLGLYELSTIANWLYNNSMEKHSVYVELVNHLK
jgi:hypothetical protein